MKFYHFEEPKFDYMAVVWANNEKEAMKTYENIIVAIDSESENKPVIIDVDDVFEMLIGNICFQTITQITIRQIIDIHKIITSKKPIVVWHNCQ